MSTKMFLRRDELVRMLALVDQFEVDLVKVHYRDGNGIGYTLDATIETKINDEVGEFKVEVTGSDGW